MTEPKPTRASQYLAKVLADIGQIEAERRTKISQSWLSRISRGLGEPNISQGLSLQAELGVQLRWWAEPPAKRRKAS